MHLAVKVSSVLRQLVCTTKGFEGMFPGVIITESPWMVIN